jgi:hypothetical protein
MTGGRKHNLCFLGGLGFPFFDLHLAIEAMFDIYNHFVSFFLFLSVKIKITDKGRSLPGHLLTGRFLDHAKPYEFE